MNISNVPLRGVKLFIALLAASASVGVAAGGSSLLIGVSALDSLSWAAINTTFAFLVGLLALPGAVLLNRRDKLTKQVSTGVGGVIGGAPALLGTFATQFQSFREMVFELGFVAYFVALGAVAGFSFFVALKRLDWIRSSGPI